MTLNDLFSKLVNFKIRFTNDLDAKPREIEVSNMPLEFWVYDYNLLRYHKCKFEEIKLNDQMDTVMIMFNSSTSKFT